MIPGGGIFIHLFGSVWVPRSMCIVPPWGRHYKPPSWYSTHKEHRAGVESGIGERDRIVIFIVMSDVRALIFPRSNRGIWGREFLKHTHDTALKCWIFLKRTKRYSHIYLHKFTFTGQKPFGLYVEVELTFHGDGWMDPEETHANTKRTKQRHPFPVRQQRSITFKAVIIIWLSAGPILLTKLFSPALDQISKL